MAQIRTAAPRQQAARPTLSWAPVTGPDGRIRMEMRWHAEGGQHGRARTSKAG